MTKPKLNFSRRESVQSNREQALEAKPIGQEILNNSTQKRLDSRTIVLVRNKKR